MKKNALFTLVSRLDVYEYNLFVIIEGFSANFKIYWKY